MSVRLVYLEHSGRGSVVRGVRLVGQGVDERHAATEPGGAGSLRESATWIAQQLAHSRAAGRVEWLCLDAEGCVCSWVTSPSDRPDIVTAVARLGAPAGDPAGGGEDAEADAGPISYFAGDPLESSIQPLPTGLDESGDGDTIDGSSRVGLLARRGKPVAAEPKRMGVLGASDLVARLFIDALDDEGIAVGSVVSLWHALGAAWDPASSLGERPEERARFAGQSTEATSVVLVDAAHPTGPRLLWAWSDRGALLAAGAMRLRGHRDDGRSPMGAFGRGEASRLAAEWLAWSIQIGRSPRRVICVLPEDADHDAQREFGRALTSAWPGAGVDCIDVPDPIGATLAKLATKLEATPPDGADRGRPGTSLRELSARPGRDHRRLFMWGAVASAAAAVLLGVIAYHVRQTAAEARTVGERWRTHAADTVRAIYPQVFERIVGPRQALQDEIDRRRHELFLPDRAQPAMPILKEFETISMVVGTGDYALETIELSGEYARLIVHANTFPAAENLVENGLQGISGSSIESWKPEYSEKDDSKGGKYIRAVYTGSWAKSTPSGGGGS